MSNSPSGRFVRTLEQLHPHDHACLIYEDPEERVALISQFVRIGLLRNERCIYVADDETPEAVLASLRRHGLDLDPARDSKRFILLSKHDTYLRNGEFSLKAMLDMLAATIDEAVAAGFNGVRVTGEMTRSLEDAVGRGRFMEYESHVNDLFARHKVLALCRYSRAHVPPETLIQAVRTHPILIHGGRICRNFYYEPPAEFTAPAKPEQELDRLLRTIHERYKAEEALHESHNRYRAMVAAVTSYRYAVHVSEGVVTSTQHGPGCLAVTGYSPEDYANDPLLWLTMIHPEDQERVLKHVGAAVDGENGPAIEHRITHRNGTTRWVRSTLVSHRDRAGRVTAYDGLVEDISDRKMTEIALQQARDDLEARVEQRTAELARSNEQLRQEVAERRRAETALRGRVKELTCLHELSHLIEQADLSVESFLRRAVNLLPRAFFSPDLVCARITLDDRQYFTPDFQNTPWKHTVPIFVGSEPAGQVELCYLEPGPADKSQPFSMEECSLVRTVAEHVGHVIERRRATDALDASRDQLLQAERLASVGTLSAGIAHEINNPIGMMLLAAQSAMRLKDHPDGDEVVTRALKSVIDNAKRCGRIVTSLLQFARQEPTEKWPGDLNPIVERAVELIADYIDGQRTKVTLDLGQDLPQVQANPLEIEQVLINLIRNAAEADEAGVEVRISTTRTAQGVRLAVQDNGPGMTAEQRTHLFDPFFTTRRNRGGTGLGLSIVHGIISQHRGTIRVESRLGYGSTFIIDLPAVTEQVEVTADVGGSDGHARD